MALVIRADLATGINEQRFSQRKGLTNNLDRTILMKDLREQAIRKWPIETKSAAFLGSDLSEEEIPFKSFLKQFNYAKSVLDILPPDSPRLISTRMAMEEARILFILRYEHFYKDEAPFKFKWIREKYVEFVKT